jgi:site-specific DNA-methyltransferase (cytosine-N4-specific)
VNIERIRVKDSFTHVWWFAKTPKAKADNRRVLSPYRDDMKKLLSRKSYNAGTRPSGHVIGEQTFFKDNGGAIPANVLEYSNTAWSAKYRQWCKDARVAPHPARMSPGLAEFFIKFLTDPGDFVLDPFGGSNTTGAVAEEHGRRWLAVEPEPAYVLGSMGRFPDLVEKAKRKQA